MIKLELFYSQNIVGNTIKLSGDEYRHCVKVKRHKSGDILKVIDGSGKIYQCTIKEIKKDEALLEINNYEEQISSAIKRIICIAPTKNIDRMEWFVEKSVEIGIDEIAIVHTDRTERTRIKLERLEKICISAMKQSLNVKMPMLLNFATLKETVEHYKNIRQKFIANGHENAAHFTSLYNAQEDSVLVLIGPEGDFTTQEIAFAKDHDLKVCSLGASRLRTETAGVVAITLINSSIV